MTQNDLSFGCSVFSHPPHPHSFHDQSQAFVTCLGMLTLPVSVIIRIIIYAWYPKQPSLNGCLVNTDFNVMIWFIIQMKPTRCFSKYQASPKPKKKHIWYPGIRVSHTQHVGVSKNSGTPKTPQNDHFYWENPWLLGTTSFGNTHVLQTNITFETKKKIIEL